MYRIADDYLNNWKKSARRKPLLVRGARQVGKTFTISQFASNSFKNYIVIDFEREPGLKQLLRTNSRKRNLTFF